MTNNKKIKEIIKKIQYDLYKNCLKKLEFKKIKQNGLNQTSLILVASCNFKTVL